MGIPATHVSPASARSPSSPPVPYAPSPSSAPPIAGAPYAGSAPYAAPAPAPVHASGPARVASPLAVAPTPAISPSPLGPQAAQAPPARPRRKTPPVDGPAAAPAWGALIAVKRDGSDGERFALAGEWVEIGRDADLTFDDRYLATRHARFERAAGGARVIPLDTLNGVFRRLRAPEPIAHGAIVLLGRELLRFEVLEAEEREVAPLVRHGVAMFGTPPRAPWGRLTQLVPNGGVRDVRHLQGAEVVIGREEGEFVFRDDEFLSRRHAILRWNGTGCVLEDLKSSNGSFVRLRGAASLAPGDTLRLGDQMFRFEPAG
jgi:pSer/pThr/pTyr-binding forkhead associated (FHA) protein